MLDLFGGDLPVLRTALGDLHANFAHPRAQGPEAYADQMQVDHQDLDGANLRAEAVLAVGAFCEALLG